jgi:hypothetical protein
MPRTWRRHQRLGIQNPAQLGARPFGGMSLRTPETIGKGAWKLAAPATK